MIRPTWLLWTFAAGVAVGAFGMRAIYGTSSAALPIPTAESPAALPGSAVEVEKPAPVASAIPLSEVTIPDANPRVENSSAGAARIVTSAGDADETVQPIDAGPVFNKMLANDAQAGHQDQIREAHRALERETRDEGWAYTMESELQGVMINEVATGAFKADHIECRATMCEVRLSGTTPLQAEAIKRWHEGFIGRAPSQLGQDLFLRHSSSIGTNERTDLLMIFVKPPPPGQQQSQPVKKEVRRVARQEGAN